jgi:hypothetical protein
MIRSALKTLAVITTAALSAVTVSPVVTAARAQLAVNEKWRTLTTPHCIIYFTEATEAVGRRAASAAERAYANLAKELVPPRGKINIVVNDATDGSNGSATSFPRSQIVINARPPVDQTSLENYDDWISLVLQHEMTHIFHLDRSRGWWALGQHIFGRNPVLFPNYYLPSWFTEGLAVYYESRYTTGGRLEGTYQYDLARAAALDAKIPRIDELSLITSRFPYGQSAYTYGAFLVDEMARHGPPGSVRAFIERTSSQTIPFLLDRNAKRTFGQTFSSGYRTWRDSVTTVETRAAGKTAYAAAHEAPKDAHAALPVGAVSVLPGGGRSAYNARWLDDSTVVYVGDNGREAVGLYRVRRTGKPVRIDRRGAFDVNDPIANGNIVFAQLDFIDRLHTPSDLYVYEKRSGVTRRLTYDARLSAPDCNVHGMVVAVQTAPGTTRLVTLPVSTTPAIQSQNIMPLRLFALDTQWAAPRWSPDGTRIAAMRLSFGKNEIMILDTHGVVQKMLHSEHNVIRALAWGPDGRTLFYVSDVSGSPQVYAIDVTQDRATPVVVMRWPSGVYSLDARGMSDGKVQLAATVLRGDGFHVAVATVQPNPHADSVRTHPMNSSSLVDTFTPVADARQPSAPYSPWRSLLPAFWSPLFSNGPAYGSQIGAVTSGRDIIGRHSYLAQALVNTRNKHVDTYFGYVYSRFLPATLELQAEQSWSYSGIYQQNNNAPVGRLDKVTRTYSAHVTFARPRLYTNSAIIVGAELEQYGYETDPDTLQNALVSFFRKNHTYPSVLMGLQFSNVQRPTLSVSNEDGVSLSVTGRQRWSTEADGSSVPSVVGSASAFKSLNFPGFAHHVLAVRVAVGATPYRSPSVYSIGGVSGGSIEVIPGITIGDQARTFPIRGYAPGTEQGNVAISGSAEYRIPLTLPSRSLGLLPLFLDKTSLSLFGDMGRAVCHKGDSGRAANDVNQGDETAACSILPRIGPTLASFGAELNLDGALQFDVPYRFRLGIAQPVTARRQFDANDPSIYVTLGTTF